MRISTHTVMVIVPQALIGQRYCNEAIPPLSITQAELDLRKEALQNNNHDISLLEKHYKLDTNHQPAQYLLHPIMFGKQFSLIYFLHLEEGLSSSSVYIIQCEEFQFFYHVVMEMTCHPTCILTCISHQLLLPAW